jgi:pyridoxal biosynthesis lyase PdxS
MGQLDKVKAGAEQAASSAQKQAQIVATKRELSQAYNELGKTAFGLVDRGELGHGDLAAGVDHIRELQARLAGDGDSAAAAGSAGDADIVE